MPPARWRICVKLQPGTSAREHHAASIRVESGPVPETLVGFRSASHEGIFTHHGESTHIHAALADALVTGHVDAVLIPKGAIVRLPQR